MRSLRRILFWILALAYVVLCPLLIVHTMGYMNTGLIIVESVHVDACVLVNGLQVAHETPATIPNLSPGIYTVRIELAGHQPWTREVFVERGQASVLDHVFLLPNYDTAETITEESFDSLHPIDGTPYIILLKKNQAAAARVFNHKGRKVIPMFPGDAPYASGDVSRVFAVRGSPYVLVQIDANKQDLYLWIGLDKRPMTIQDITSLMNPAPSEVLWSAEAPGLLFCYRTGSVNKVDLRRGTNELNFASEWIGMGVFDQVVCGLDAETHFIRKNLDGKIIVEEKTELKLDRSLFSKIRFIHILPMMDGALLFHESGGALFQTELPHLLVEKGVVGIRVFDEADRALVWRSSALGLLEKSGQEEEKKVFTDGRRIRWIYEGSEDVASPYFMYGGAYALCLLNGVVNIFDLREGKAPPDEPREAFRVRKGTAFHYVDRDGMLYALDPHTGRFVAIRILPIGPLSDRFFPERAVEKGSNK